MALWMKRPRLYRLHALASAGSNATTATRTTGSDATPEPYEPATHLPTPLRELFEGHAPFVCRSLSYLGVPEADLDATLHDVFTVVFKRLDEYEKQEWVRAWLYSICARVSRAYGHAAWRRPEHSEDSEALAFGDRLLAQLPPLQREAFLLYEVEDMPLGAVAQALGCTPRTAYARLQAARVRIVADVERIAAQGEHEHEWR